MMPSAKIVYLLFLFMGFSSFSYGQSNLNHFLISAAQESELDIYQSQISYLNKQPYRMSPVRELEFRTQTNEIGANEQRYGLRLSPANPWEVRNTKRVFKSYQSLLSLKKELAFKEILTSRYLMLTEFLYLKGMQQLKSELLENLNAQIGIMENQSASEFFEAEDYVKLKLEQMEEQADLEAFDFYLSQRLKEMERLQGTGSLETSGLSFDSVIPLKQLNKVIDSLLAGPMHMTQMAYHKEKIKLAEHQYALERSDINPGFIQAAYRPYQYSENRNPIGINLGITIPLFNPNKGKMAEEKLEILEAESEMALEKERAEEELEKLLASLANYLERYERLEAQMSSYDINKMLDAVNALNKENPSIGLKFHARLLKLKKVQLEVKKEVYLTYIQILSRADLLGQRPLLNFFSAELEKL